MSLARYLSKLGALLTSDGKVTPSAMANGGSEFASNNLICNGGLDVWQKGTTISNWGSFAYPTDNVQIGYDGSPASGRTLTQQVFAMGQADVNEGDPKFFLQYVFPNCGTPNNYFRFPVEGVRTLAGKKGTFSFWARVPSGTMTIGVSIAQEFGSGGSPSGGVYPSQTNYTITTTWQKFVYTTTLASIAGKTIGTNNNDMIWPAIYCPPNAAGTIQIANLKLEEGAVATPFQRRPFAVEKAWCERFVSTSYPSGVSPGSVNSQGCPSRFTDASGMYCSNWVAFPSQMRAIPTVTLYSPLSGAAGQIAGDIASKTGRVDMVGSSGFQGGAANVSTGAGEAIRFHYFASSEL